MITGVLSAEYANHRDEIWPFLLNFAERDLDGMTAHEIELGIISRDRQAWNIRNFQALALTQVTRDAVRITHCGGVRRGEWQTALDDEIKAWAKALGKKRVVALVRPGWARFGKAQGYREAHREMTLEI